MSNGVQARRLPAKRHVLERIALWQLGCVFAIVACILFCEICDFQALFFGSEPSDINWQSAGMMSVMVLGFGLAAVAPVHIYHRRNFSKSVTICSYCRRVQVKPESWDQIEMFFANETHATYSHGVCPDCCDKVMSAYRSGRKDAGAREPLPTEVLVS